MKKIMMFVVVISLVTLYGQGKIYIWQNNTITDSMTITNDLKMTFKAGSTVQEQDPGTGLLAYFPFNNNTNDESGNGNNGINGGAVSVPDRFGNVNCAYKFSNGAYVEVPRSYKIEPRSGLTCAAWVFPDSIQDWGNILTKRYNEFDFPFNSYILNKTPSTNNKWEFYSSESAKLYDAAEVKPQAWSFLVGTWDGTKNYFYVNGVKVAEIANSNPMIYSTLSLRIGTAIIVSDKHRLEQGFNGKIDDIRIFGRALTENEIQLLYHENGWN
jgi:hypothetical protein